MLSNKIKFETIHCDLCESIEDPYVLEYETDFLNLRETLYRICCCKRCNAVYMNPRPTREELSKVYNEDYLQKNCYDIESVNEKRINEIYPQKIHVLKKYKPFGRLLDVGAGIGGFIYLAKKEGYDAEGWDPSNSEVALAKKKYNIDLKCGILSESSYSPETFDIIHMHHVLEHVPNPTESLRLIFNLLKPEGYFLFEVPNDFRSSVFYYNRLKKFFGKDTSFVKPSIHHLYFYDYCTVIKYAKKIDFEIIFIKGSFQEVEFRLPVVKNLLLAVSFKRFCPAFEILWQKRVK